MIPSLPKKNKHSMPALSDTNIFTLYVHNYPPGLPCSGIFCFPQSHSQFYTSFSVFWLNFYCENNLYASILHFISIFIILRHSTLQLNQLISFLILILMLLKAKLQNVGQENLIMHCLYTNLCSYISPTHSRLFVWKWYSLLDTIFWMRCLHATTFWMIQAHITV